MPNDTYYIVPYSTYYYIRGQLFRYLLITYTLCIRIYPLLITHY